MFIIFIIINYKEITHDCKSTNSLRFVFSTCYCSKNYISILMKQFDSDCTIKCAGDNEASCGGSPNFVSSYITDSSSESK